MFEFFRKNRLLSGGITLFNAIFMLVYPILSYSVPPPTIEESSTSAMEFFNSDVRAGYENATVWPSGAGEWRLNEGTPNETTIDAQSVFGQGMGWTAGDMRMDFYDSYGNDADIIGNGTMMSNQLDALGGTPIGGAFDVIKDLKNNGRANFASDPMLEGSRTTVTNAGLLDGFSGCSSSTTVSASTRNIKTEDIRTCDRVLDQGGENCAIVHSYWRDPPVFTPNCPTFSSFSEVEVLHGPVNYGDRARARAHCNPWLPENQVVLEYYLVDVAFNHPPCHGWRSATVSTSEPVERYLDTISPNLHGGCDPVAVTVRGGCSGDNCNYRLRFYERRGISWNSTENSDAYCQGVELPVNVSGVQDYAQRWNLNPSPYDYSCTTFPCTFSGSACLFNWSEITLSFAKPKLNKTLGAVHENYTNTCASDLNALLNMCTINSSCSTMPQVTGGCTGTGDFRICDAELQAPPFPWVNKFCNNTDVSVACDPAATAAMDCFWDVNGIWQCPVVEFNKYSDCAALETDPNCLFLGSSCIENSTAEDGVTCLVNEETYDCGQTVTLSTSELNTVASCAGAPVRCMGEECVTGSGSKSTSFGEAHAYTQMMNMMGLETDCSGGACRIFVGENLQCTKAVGGIQNCCKHPSTGFGVVDYIKLMFAMAKADGYVQDLDPSNSFLGAWNLVRDPLVDAWESISSIWTEPATSTAGATGAVANEAAQAGMIETFKQDMMRNMYEFLQSNFNDEIANMIFAEGTGGTITLNTTLGTVFYTIGLVMTIVVVTELVVAILFPCEPESFELGAKKEMKSCHFVGRYCKKDTPFGCLEKANSYCCFNSPLARIVMQEIRKQGIGGVWGSAEAPNCDGIAVSDINQVDWSQVDLSEWVAFLDLAGKLPDVTNINTENLTGNGSPLDFEDAGVVIDRPNVIERTTDRMQGIDYQQTYQDGKSAVESGL
jgi:hypothetical protein